MADQGTEGLLSPYLRKKRFNEAMPYLKGKILDVGCGAGALAQFISSDHYLGFDPDRISLQKARQNFPQHQFVEELPLLPENFDTIVALAVIEHVKDTASFLKTLAVNLKNDVTAQIIITTPHPSCERIHHIGAALGLFSRHANEEHESLFDFKSIQALSKNAQLKLISYKRFLLGMNQLIVLRRGY